MGEARGEDEVEEDDDIEGNEKVPGMILDLGGGGMEEEEGRPITG